MRRYWHRFCSIHCTDEQRVVFPMHAPRILIVDNDPHSAIADGRYLEMGGRYEGAVARAIANANARCQTLAAAADSLMFTWFRFRTGGSR